MAELLDLDPYSDAFIADPYPGYERMRRAGAAFRLVAKGRFDGVADLAEAYPLKVFPDAVGLDAAGRENLLPYGAMVFNGFGPLNERFHASMANAGVVVPWIMAKCRREALASGVIGR